MGERLDGTNGMTCSVGNDLMLPRGQTSIVPHQAHQAEDKVSFVSKDRKEELKHLQPCRDFLHVCPHPHVFMSVCSLCSLCLFSGLLGAHQGFP